MTSHATSQAAPSAAANLLRYTLRADGIFSAVGGVLCLTEAKELAAQLGIQPPLVLSILGGALLLYGAFLFFASMPAQLNRRVATVAMILDALWVLDSVVLLIAGWLPLTSAGVWGVALVAVVVAIFGELKFLGLRRN